MCNEHVFSEMVPPLVIANYPSTSKMAATQVKSGEWVEFNLEYKDVKNICKQLSLNGPETSTRCDF